MSTWRDFVTNALLGTERATPLDLPPPVTATLDETALARLGREARFLTRAGAYAAWRRAAWRPPISPGAATRPPPAAESAGMSDHDFMSRASASHLRAMLGGTHSAVLPEWLEEAARLHRPAPPELLPALLEHARRHPERRALALAVGGPRAEWLAEQNPAWSFAAGHDPARWEVGEPEERAAIFRAWRSEDPAQAREKIAAGWKHETPEARAALLAELEPQLSDGDIPFLEAALDDRAKDVRREAAALLALLPASPLSARMIKRADTLLTFKPGGLLRRAVLTASLPDETDPNAARDGLDARAFGLQVKLGARAILLVQIVAAIPLRHWADTCRLPPAGLLKAVGKDRHAAAVATGWALAAAREGSAEWAAALLDAPVPPYAELLPGDPLLPLLPGPVRVRRLLPGIHASFLLGGGKPELPVEILKVRNAFPEGFLPEPLAREVLAALRRAATIGIPWHQREEIEAILARVPPAMLPEAAENWPSERDGVAGFVDLLNFRRQALQTLTTL